MGTLAVDNIQHTDGSSAVTLNNANITTGTIPAAGITGTLGSGVTISTLGLVFLGSKTTSTATAQLEFKHNVAATGGTPDFSSTYCAHLFIVENYRPATDGGQMRCRYSTDGGNNYVSSGYDGFSDHGNTSLGTNLNSTDSFRMGTSVQGGSYATEGWSGQCWLYGSSNVKSHLFHFSGFHQTGASNFYAIRGWYWNTAPGSPVDIDAVKFYFHSGNINTGTVRMYGLKA